MPTTTVPDTSRAARLFHALSDETRLEIMRLVSHGERCVCELQNVLDAAQSRLSFHLKTLKAAGLVSDRRDGGGPYSPRSAVAIPPRWPSCTRAKCCSTWARGVGSMCCCPPSGSAGWARRTAWT